MLQTASAEFCYWLLQVLTSLQGGIPVLNIAQDCPSRCRMPDVWLIDFIMTKSHYQCINYQLYCQITTQECVLTHIHLFFIHFYQSNAKYITIEYKHGLFEFSLNVFIEFAELRDWKYLSSKEFEPAASGVRDQGATTVSTRHTWETGSLIGPNSCFSDLSDSLNLLNSHSI